MVVPHKQKLTRDTWSIGKTAATAEPSETQVQARQVQPVGQASVLRPCKLGTNLMVSHGHRGYSRVLRRAARHGTAHPARQPCGTPSPTPRSAAAARRGDGAGGHGFIQPGGIPPKKMHPPPPPPPFF